jgi:hypothetical protein
MHFEPPDGLTQLAAGEVDAIVAHRYPGVSWPCPTGGTPRVAFETADTTAWPGCPCVGRTAAFWPGRSCSHSERAELPPWSPNYVTT